MADRYRKVEDYVVMFVDSLKNPKNLPYKIVRFKCPDRKKICRKRHGEIVIKKYDRKQDQFLLDYYGVHERKVEFTFWQNIRTVKKFMLQSIKKRLITVPEIRKKLVRDSYFRDHLIGLRFTETEMRIIEKKAKKKNLKVYDYLRLRALT